MRLRVIVVVLVAGVIGAGVHAAFGGAGKPRSLHLATDRLSLAGTGIDVGAGIRLRYPVGWHVITRPLTSVASPVQRLVVTSFPLVQARSDKGCMPATAIRKMSPGGAFLYMFEYTGLTRQSLARFARRPSHFQLDRKSYARYECFGLSYMARFRDAGREFQVHFYLGPRAGRKTRTMLLSVLNGLIVKPLARSGASATV